MKQKIKVCGDCCFFDRNLIVSEFRPSWCNVNGSSVKEHETPPELCPLRSRKSIKIKTEFVEKSRDIMVLEDWYQGKADNYEGDNNDY
jgi:hypothetical protein